MKEGAAPHKPAKWRLSPSGKSSALMWQARGGQHQNTPATGRIFSKLWSDPHTASMPVPGRACEASHPRSKQREEDGKSEAWCSSVHLRAKRCGQEFGNIPRPRPQGHFD